MGWRWFTVIDGVFLHYPNAKQLLVEIPETNIVRGSNYMQSKPEIN